MNEQKNSTESSKPPEVLQGAVALIVDYSNGVQKIFTGIPWKPNMSVLDALEAAGSISPGVAFEYEEEVMDRGGNMVGHINSIDEVRAGSDDSHWRVWVNQHLTDSVDLRMATPTGIELGNFGSPQIRPGVTVLLKLSTG